MNRESALQVALQATPTEWGSSRYAVYSACQYKHHLEYHLRLTNSEWETAVALDVGILVHSCLAYLALGAQEGACWPVEDVLVASAAPEDIKAEARRLMAAYQAHWGEINAGWKSQIVAVEQEVRIDFPNSMPYSTRLDMVVEIGGRLAIVDHKTRSTKIPDGSTYPRVAATWPQFLGAAACLIDTHKLDYVPPLIMNGIIKTKLPSFARLPIQSTEEQIEEWKRQHYSRASGGLEGKEKNFYACGGRFEHCKYFSFCHGSQAEKEKFHETP